MAEQRARAAERRRRAAESGVKLAVGYRERANLERQEEVAGREAQEAEREADRAREEAQEAAAEEARRLIDEAALTVSYRRGDDEAPPFYRAVVDGSSAGAFSSPEETAEEVSRAAGPGSTVEVYKDGSLVVEKTVEGKPRPKAGFPWALLAVPLAIAAASS